MEEIVTKVRLDIEGFAASVDEARKEGNKLVADLEKKDIKVNIEPKLETKSIDSSFGRLRENISSKFSEITNGISDQFKSIGASASAAFNTLKAAGVSSFRAIGGAIAASGIGLLPIALGIIAANWDKITSAISGTTDKMKSFGEAAKGVEKLQESILKMEANFELAKTKVITKDEALKKYNETLGKTYGTFKSYNEAESFFIKSTPLMIEAAIARQSADILIKKAAEKNIELLTLREQKEASFLEKLAFGDKFAKTRLADKKIGLITELGIDQKRINGLQKNAETLNNKLKQLALDSGATFGESKDFSNSVKTGTEDLRDSKAAKKAIENSKKVKEAKEKDEKELNSERLKFNAAMNEKELQDLADKKKAQQDEREDANKTFDEEAAKIDKRIKEEAEKKKKAQQELLDKQRQALEELLGFAKNGILLQIGLNPNDVNRLEASIRGIVDKIKNNKPIDAGEMAEAAGNAYFAISNAIAANDAQKRQEELAALQSQQEEELRLAGDNEQKKEIIRQKYALKEKEIKRKQAEADKRKAIFDATVNTAVAVITGFVRGGPILAAVAAVLGAAQIALIAATPIPKFAKGVVSFDGKGGLVKGEGTGTSDSNLAYLSRGESVIPAEPTSANLGLINELVNGDVESYINRHYVMPALKAKEGKANEIYRHSVIEAENNLIAKISSHTLKSIHKEQRNTTEAIKRLDKKNYSW